MAGYYCLNCGGRTGMMGHKTNCNPRLLRIIERLVEEGIPRERAVEAVGGWQLGELQLPP